MAAAKCNCHFFEFLYKVTTILFHLCGDICIVYLYRFICISSTIHNFYLMFSRFESRHR